MSSNPSTSSSSSLFFAAPPRILVIVEDVTLADELVAILESAHYEVEVATDGKYALMLAADFSADLVILDTDLQGTTTSSEVVQVLRGAPQLSAHYRRIPILFLAESRFLINQRFHQHPNAPISDYVFKPIQQDLLLDRIRRFLDEAAPPATN